MSRQTKYTIIFTKDGLVIGGLSVKINLKKSFEAKTGLRQTYVENGENRPVRTVKVLAKEDVKPKELEDVEKVIAWNAVQSSAEYRDTETGEVKLLPLDDMTRCKMFKKSENMKALGLVSCKSIHPYMYTGDHYFVGIQCEGKSKKAAAADEQGYSLLYALLAEYEKMLLVQFVSGEREKYAVIYQAGDGLMMSLLIHNNYQREAPAVTRVPIPKLKEFAAKMLKLLDMRKFNAEVTDDKYEDALIRYIEEERKAKEDAANGVKPKSKTIPRKREVKSLDMDFFSQLEALPGGETEAETVSVVPEAAPRPKPRPKPRPRVVKRN